MAVLSFALLISFLIRDAKDIQEGGYISQMQQKTILQERKCLELLFRISKKARGTIQKQHLMHVLYSV